jgi:hypothetical protein
MFTPNSVPYFGISLDVLPRISPAPPKGFTDQQLVPRSRRDDRKHPTDAAIFSKDAGSFTHDLERIGDRTPTSMVQVAVKRGR